jgi:hypothetical protein
MNTKIQRKPQKEKPAQVTEYIVFESFTGKKGLKESLLDLMKKDIKDAKTG